MALTEIHNHDGSARARAVRCRQGQTGRENAGTGSTEPRGESDRHPRDRGASLEDLREFRRELFEVHQAWDSSGIG
jgi:hypothetical protein